MKIIGYLRNLPAGTGRNSVSVAIKKKVDDSTVDTDTTASDAFSYDNDGEFSFAADGNPGPTYITATYGGQTKRRGSREAYAAGTWFPAEHPYYMLPLGDGVSDGVANEMAVSAAGTMNLSVATGQALVQGHLYRCTSATTATITTADATNPRIDRVILRLTQIGQTEEGKLAIVVLAGTPAASPSAPALTQTSATWEISLCQVAVAAGTTSINSGNLTDERSFHLSKDLYATLASPTFTGTVTAAAITASGTVTLNGDTVIGNTSNDLLTIQSRIYSTGTSPAIAAGAAAGTGTASLSGTDTAGVITLTSGTGRTTGTLFTVTFNTTKDSANYIVLLLPQEADALSDFLYVRAFQGTTAAWTADVPTTAINNNEHKWQYFVVEYQP